MEELACAGERTTQHRDDSRFPRQQSPAAPRKRRRLDERRRHATRVNLDDDSAAIAAGECGAVELEHYVVASFENRVVGAAFLRDPDDAAGAGEPRAAAIAYPQYRIGIEEPITEAPLAIAFMVMQPFAARWGRARFRFVASVRA